jgi:hypothetical protein
LDQNLDKKMLLVRYLRYRRKISVILPKHKNDRLYKIKRPPNKDNKIIFAKIFVWK